MSAALHIDTWKDQASKHAMDKYTEFKTTWINIGA